MLDPLTAVSLAGSIVQFVSFSYKLVTGAKALRESGTGRKAEHEESDIIANCVIELNESLVALESASLTTGNLSRGEKSLLPLRKECVKIGNELMDVLRRLQVSKAHNSWDSVRKALRSIMKEGRIRDLENRLLKLQRQIDSHLISDIQYVETSKFLGNGSTV
jgi:hypothetical protein